MMVQEVNGLATGGSPPDTIAALAPLLQSRKISPVQVVEFCLSRIDSLNGRLCAYSAILADDALNHAREAERELQRGQIRGPLHGVPISVKDVYKTRAAPTTWGSKPLAHYGADVDAAVVERLREAGAVLIGKTNVDMHPYHGSPEAPRLIGPTRNPWDLDRTAGRSSGGSASAVAARLDYGSIGSDTGGSVRIPAAFCGVVGIKPTFGRISRHGVLLYSDSFDHCGPIARCVRDCACLLGAIAGHDPRDSTSVMEEVPDWTGGLDESVRGLRVGVPYQQVEGNQVDVRQLFLAATERLNEAGCEIRPIHLPALADAHWIRILSTLETTAMAERTMALTNRDDAWSKFIAARAAGERGRLLEHGHQLANSAQAKYRDVFREIDVIAMPTVPIAAPKFSEERSPWQLPEESFWELPARHTRIFNFIGYPAITIPCGFTLDAMPVGLQFAAPPLNEAVLFRAACAYERATDWHTRRPAPAQE
jgi:aspartyl-tRNA(Asn)/glutamyl-tRNA(Gln) amidotransferase subunit A